MNIALLGMGRMGQAISRVIADTDHQISLRLDDVSNAFGAGLTEKSLAGVDVAIDFTGPEAVVANVEALARHGVPLVIGTTGWYGHIDHVRRLVDEGGIGCVYGANFSIGANIFLKMTEFAAALMNRFPEYDPYVLDHHHRGKLDAPSGTALRLADAIVERLDHKSTIQAGHAANTIDTNALNVVSVRAGAAFGRHEVGFDSTADTITLEHTARGREGFARGAVFAAEWVRDKKGLTEFSTLFAGGLT